MATIETAAIRQELDPQEVGEMLIEVLTCDRCGAPETPSNPIEFRCGASGAAAVLAEGPPEWFSECAACTSKDEVPF